MDRRLKKKSENRTKRAWRVRKTLHGTAQRPRLSVKKTNRHLGVQLIDDDNGVTLGSTSTLSKSVGGMKKGKEAAAAMGKQVAEMCKNMSVETVIFDRGHHKYHGLLAELAEAARGAGLKF